MNLSLVASIACSLALLPGCTNGDAHSTSSATSSSTETQVRSSSNSASASACLTVSSDPAPSLTGSAPVLADGSPSAAPSTSADAPASDKPACPAHMALVGRYCIDQYEDALEEMSGDDAWSAHPYYERPPSDARYRAVDLPGQFPQAYISRVESKAACEASGKRLCTKHEWQHACRGKGFQTYPYGEKGVRDRCNAGKIHLLTQMFKNPPGGMKYMENFNSPELNKTPGFLAKSGEYAGCTTELGVADMVGNLHEWVSDTVTQDLMDKLDEENVERRNQPWHEGNGVFMGGFYSTTSEHGPGCYFITVAHEPTYHDYSTGFRCCEDASLPPPTKTAKSTQPPKKPRPLASASPAVNQL